MNFVQGACVECGTKKTRFVGKAKLPGLVPEKKNSQDGLEKQKILA
jgi:hypothetical protein